MSPSMVMLPSNFLGRFGLRTVLPAALGLSLLSRAAASVVVYDVSWIGGGPGWQVDGSFSYDSSAEDLTSPSGGRVDASELLSSSFTLIPPAAHQARWSPSTIAVSLAPTVQPFIFLPGSVAFESFAVRGTSDFTDPLDFTVASRTLTFQSTINPSASMTLVDSFPTTWETSGSYTFTSVPEPAETGAAMAAVLLGAAWLRRMSPSTKR